MSISTTTRYPAPVYWLSCRDCGQPVAAGHLPGDLDVDSQCDDCAAATGPACHRCQLNPIPAADRIGYCRDCLRLILTDH